LALTPQTLFRVAIAIIKLAENDMCACESVSDLFAFVGGMTSRLWAADKLIAVGQSKALLSEEPSADPPRSAQLQAHHTTRGPRGEVREASRGVATGSARVMLDAL
jgi:glutamate 5-kinase